MLNKIHVTEDGREIPVVSMEDDHLVNTIRYLLLKRPYEYEQDLREEYLSEYADENLPSNLNALLGKKRFSKESKTLLEDSIRDKVDQYLVNCLELSLPYLIVGMSRSNTYKKVHSILQTFTGITDKVIINSKYLLESDEEFYEVEDDY